MYVKGQLFLSLGQVKTRVLPKLAATKQRLVCGAVIRNALRLFYALELLFGILKAAGKIKPELLHVHENGSVLPYARIRFFKKLIMEGFYLALFRLDSVSELADERGIGSKSAPNIML